MNYAYSPDTGEIISVNVPGDWMGSTQVEPPSFNRATEGCFWRGSAWEIVVATPDLVKLKADASAIIDSAAGAARVRYITICPGQEITYMLKAQEAAAFKSGGYTGGVPGLVQAEIDAYGYTPQQAADLILATQAIWQAKAGQIESARRCGKAAVSIAADVPAIDAARTLFTAKLAGL
jgi:hypothetical protein